MARADLVAARVLGEIELAEEAGPLLRPLAHSGGTELHTYQGEIWPRGLGLNKNGRYAGAYRLGGADAESLGSILYVL